MALTLSNSIFLSGTAFNAVIEGAAATSTLALTTNPGGRWSLGGRLLVCSNPQAGDAPAVTETLAGGGSTAYPFTISARNAPSTLRVSGSPGPVSVGMAPAFFPVIEGGTPPYYIQVIGRLPAGRSISGLSIIGTYVSPGPNVYALQIGDSAGANVRLVLSENVAGNAGIRFVPIDANTYYLTTAGTDGVAALAHRYQRGVGGADATDLGPVYPDFHRTGTFELATVQSDPLAPIGTFSNDTGSQSYALLDAAAVKYGGPYHGFGTGTAENVVSVDGRVISIAAALIGSTSTLRTFPATVIWANGGTAGVDWQEVVGPDGSVSEAMAITNSAAANEYYLGTFIFSGNAVEAIVEQGGGGYYALPATADRLILNAATTIKLRNPTDGRTTTSISDAPSRVGFSRSEIKRYATDNRTKGYWRFSPGAGATSTASRITRYGKGATGSTIYGNNQMQNADGTQPITSGWLAQAGGSNFAIVGGTFRATRQAGTDNVLVQPFAVKAGEVWQVQVGVDSTASGPLMRVSTSSAGGSGGALVNRTLNAGINGEIFTATSDATLYFVMRQPLGTAGTIANFTLPTVRKLQSVNLSDGSAVGLRTIADLTEFKNGNYLAFMNPFNKGPITAYRDEMTIKPSIYPNDTIYQGTWPGTPDGTGNDQVAGAMTESYGNYIYPNFPSFAPIQISALTSCFIKQEYDYNPAFPKFNQLTEFYVLDDATLDFSPAKLLAEIGWFTHWPAATLTYFLSATSVGTWTDFAGVQWEVRRIAEGNAGNYIMLMPVDRVERKTAVLDVKGVLTWLASNGYSYTTKYLTGGGMLVEPYRDSGSPRVHFKRFDMAFNNSAG